MFLPKFSSSGTDNFTIYLLFVTLAYTIYVSGGFLSFAKDIRYFINNGHNHELCRKFEESILWKLKNCMIETTGRYISAY